MTDYLTNHRITEINRELSYNQQNVIWTLIGFLMITVFMIVPYGFLLSGAITNKIFMTIFVFIMFSYLFYVIYVLDIYHIRTTINQRISEIGLDEWRNRVAEYINENCDCKVYNNDK